jgi:hypothetical protein
MKSPVPHPSIRYTGKYSGQCRASIDLPIGDAAFVLVETNMEWKTRFRLNGTFQLKAASKGFHQFQRRFIICHGAPHKLLHPAPAIENPEAFRTGGNVLLYFALGFDRKFEVQVCIQI